MSIDEAMAAIETGDIQDGKTIMLLQYAFIHLFQTRGGQTLMSSITQPLMILIAGPYRSGDR